MFALGLEFRELLWRQDGFGVFHEFRLARFVATSLVMFRHSCVHLCLLVSVQVEGGHGGLTRCFCFVSDFRWAVAMFACEHSAGHKESRCCYRNEFSHIGI